MIPPFGVVTVTLFKDPVNGDSTTDRQCCLGKKEDSVTSYVDRVSGGHKEVLYNEHFKYIIIPPLYWYTFSQYTSSLPPLSVFIIMQTGRICKSQGCFIGGNIKSTIVVFVTREGEGKDEDGHLRCVTNRFKDHFTETISVSRWKKKVFVDYFSTLSSLPPPPP